MKLIITLLLTALLGACSTPTFVGDVPPVPVTSQTPDHFELPARFAFARAVYGSTQAAGAEEAAIWTDLASRAQQLGSFVPLISGDRNNYRYANLDNLTETAREQRYDYLLLVKMDPATGSADVALIHTGSGGVMATVQAVSPDGGQRGFWGGPIRNPARLDRATLKIAQVTAPSVEEMLRGAVERQR
jgi:hypothetical protein